MPSLIYSKLKNCSAEAPSGVIEAIRQDDRAGHPLQRHYLKHVKPVGTGSLSVMINVIFTVLPQNKTAKQNINVFEYKLIFFPLPGKT